MQVERVGEEKRGCWASLRCCGQILCRCRDGEKKEKKKREGHGREAGNGKKTSRHRISCTHGRYINKQHAKTSAVHILATRLKLHQTVFFFSFSSSKTGIVVRLCKQNTSTQPLFLSSSYTSLYQRSYTSMQL